jgi:hypothetical protein
MTFGAQIRTWLVGWTLKRAEARPVSGGPSELLKGVEGRSV